MKKLLNYVLDVLDHSGLNIVHNYKLDSDFNILIKDYPDPVSDDIISIALSVSEKPDEKIISLLAHGALKNKTDEAWIVVPDCNVDNISLINSCKTHSVRLIKRSNFSLKIISDFSFLTKYIAFPNSSELYSVNFLYEIPVVIHGKQTNYYKLQLYKYSNRLEHTHKKPSEIINVISDYIGLYEDWLMKKSYYDELLIDEPEFITVSKEITFLDSRDQTKLFISPPLSKFWISKNVLREYTDLLS